jgi:hypothetical protein
MDEEIRTHQGMPTETPDNCSITLIEELSIAVYYCLKMLMSVLHLRVFNKAG